MSSTILSVIFPRSCLVCHVSLRKAFLCSRCTPKINPLITQREGLCLRCSSANALEENGICFVCRALSSPIHATRYLWTYAKDERDLIHAMKYDPSIKLARYLGERMADALLPTFVHSDWDFVVPIPSSRAQFRKRGFNQTVFMAKIIAERCRSPLNLRTLIHQGTNQPQAQVKKEDRLVNVRNSFQIKEDVTRRKILLVDDVITSGATTAVAAHAMKESGALRVDVIAACRAESWDLSRLWLSRLCPQSSL